VANEEKVTIHLRNSVGKGGVYYGPGVCEVPYSFAESVAATQGRAVADLEEDAALVKQGVDLEAPQPRVRNRAAAPSAAATDTGDAGGDKGGDDGDDDALPEDFPARAALEESGYATLTDVRQASDEELLDINGIGKVLLQRIREAQG
jgi:DNA uptake protein ComE-like DNA-binding protein